jgi:hypothetical protein
MGQSQSGNAGAKDSNEWLHHNPLLPPQAAKYAGADATPVAACSGGSQIK